jgi:protein TonB
MFDTLLAARNSGKMRVRKGLTFSLSVMLHAAAIAAVIVVPLLRAETELPRSWVIDAALIAPPIMPGVPPGPGRNGRTAGPAGPNKPTDPPPVSGPARFMAPIEVPTEISEENPADLVPEGPGGPGIVGGSGDGERPWMFGDKIVPDEITPAGKAMTTIRPPRLIKRVNPIYSPAAIAARVSGSVVIAAVTDIYGRVREARIVSGHALLSASALEAVRKWVYEPYLVNGIPRPVSFTVTVTFTLEKR